MAFCTHENYLFWYGNNIEITNSSNKKVGNYCNFGYCYQLIEGIQYNTDYSKSFLAGNYNQWLTT
jgi:hypothetical protein